MAEIVQSLFGVTPEMYQQNQQARIDAQALQFAKLDPFERANYGISRGANMLAGALGRSFGGEDPAERMIAQRQQIMQQIDITNPASMARGVDLFTRMNDFAAAQELATKLQATRKAQQETLKTGAEAEKLGSENLARQAQIRQLVTQLGVDENQATAIASNPDLLKQYLTPKSQQGVELLKTGKFSPESVNNWIKGSGNLEVIDKFNKPEDKFIAKAVQLKFGEKAKYGDYTPEQVAAVNTALFNENIAAKKAGAQAIQIPLGDVLQKVFQARETEDAAKAFGQAGEAYTITVPLISKLKTVEDTVSNAFTGAGQNYKLALSKGLSALGVKVSDRATDTEFGDAISAQVVQQIAKVFPGSQSNKELDQLLKSKFNLQQELPTILRLVSQIKDEMLAQTKTYEQMANLPATERTGFNAKLAQGQNYQKIQQYRDYEKKYLNKTITAEERAQAAKLKQELNF
jgi:hypothetical protein